MRRIEESACLSPWRERTVEVVVLCAGLMACSLLSSTVFGGLSVLFLSILLAASTRIPLGEYLRKLLLASGFAVVSILPLSMNVSFHPAFALHVDPDGIRNAMLALARAIGTLSVTLLFAFTTPFSRLLSLLRCLHAPNVLLELLTLVYREIFVMDEAFTRLRKTLVSRNGWRSRHTSRRSLALGVAALFVNAMDRSERLEKGLASRGVANGHFTRWDPPIKIRPSALFGAAVVPIAMYGWICWREGHFGF